MIRHLAASVGIGTIALLGAGCARGDERLDFVTLSAAAAAASFDVQAGELTGLRVGARGMEMARYRPAGCVEVEDLRDHRVYAPGAWKASVGGRRMTGESGRRVLEFVRQYEGAPFAVAHAVSERPEGVRWEVALRLRDGQTLPRSVRVSWLLPLPAGWRFWVPNDTRGTATDGVTPHRAVYGHTHFRDNGTIIPLAGVWSRQGGAAVWSPPDVQKPMMTFDVYTQRSSPRARGMRPGADCGQRLKVSYELVGLRPGRELRLAICIAGIEPDWRCALGHYVRTYPELFEPVPAARRFEGMYGIGSLARMTEDTVETLRREGVTVYELHGSFAEYGWWVRAEHVAEPDAGEFVCRPHPTEKMTIATNREWIRRLTRAGVGPIMYFYNVHARRDTIEKHFADDLFRDESGRPMSQYRGNEFALRGVPDSGYGRHVLQQAELMLKAYPEAPGFFLDNYSIHMLSFAHDDGVTMVRNRPAYDLNRNHQVLGPACMAKFHRAGKVCMINKCMTIESARGADMVLAETRGLGYYKQLALACCRRALLPLGWRPRRGDDTPERAMQHILLLGGLPDRTLREWDRSVDGNTETFDRYRRLTDALIGKRWVLEREPLAVPAGLEGQIFRIDRHAPHADDVVVTLVDPGKSWKDKSLREAAAVTIAIGDGERFRTAAWLGVEDAAGKPRPCPIRREDGKLVVELPPVGAAGVLRLSR